jgi:hypothetical protein
MGKIIFCSFLLIASLIFNLAQASESKIVDKGDIEYCIEMSEIAEETMRLRQNGESFGALYKINMGEESLTRAVRGIVTEAFNVPVFKSADDKNKAENWFREKIVSLCIKEFERRL